MNIKWFLVKYRKSLIRYTVFVFFIAAILLRERVYLEYYAFNYVEEDAIFKQNQRNFESVHSRYESSCSCRPNPIDFIKNNDFYEVYFIDLSNKNSSKKYDYRISTKEFESSIFTCDMYNVLKRGPNVKVLSYSLYGKNRFYYDFLPDLVRLIKKRYPDWFVRVYYDSSIDKSIICQIECLREENILYDNVDFCNIERLPYDTTKTWNASYMHGMTWRWLPIGDSFIDYFGSRDTDAWISEREIDSLNVWMKSNNIFHIMRDAPVHNIPIVGGYWSYANIRDRRLSDYLFKILTNPHIARYYNQIKNEKGRDQHLLTNFFSKYSLKNSTTHDSFLCSSFGGDPWPSKRPAYHCFVGCIMCCEQVEEKQRVNYSLICPKKCRPKDHQDWIHC